MNSASLFQRQTGKVRDSETVLVLREVSTNGVVLYRKRFKAQGFDIWAARENQFFSLFSLKKLQKVVRPETIKNSEHGGVSEVVTFDAGLTIEEWLQVKLVGQAGHVFAQGDNFMRLARACLLALQEIHTCGVMHCDIKPDNICLPYTPKDLKGDFTQPISIDFEQIRLIDFSFSLSADIPLDNAVLPLDSRSSYAEYLAPAFKAAILADQQAGRPQQVKTLDACVDLYSLGFMLDKLLARGGITWPNSQGETLARELVQALMQTAQPDCHAIWLDKLTAWLADAPVQQAFVIESAQSNDYHIPATPLIATPLVAPVVPAAVPAKLPLDKFPKKYWPWAGGALALLAIVLLWSTKGSSSGIDMVKIPGQAYEIAKYEITQAQWQAIMGKNPSQFKDCPNCPVETVPWNEVQLFLQKLNAKTGKTYRLPSSEEWEFACMGGVETRYCGGDEIDALGWHIDNSEEKTHPIGQKQPNAYGVYDMSGNVAEWTADCVNDDCGDRIVRGGSWISEAKDTRSRRRARQDELRIQNATAVPATAAGNNLGFRIALTVEK